MRKMSVMTGLTVLFGVAFLATGAYCGEPTAKGWDRAYEVRDIVGTYVMNPQGEYLGRIENLIIDSNGRANFLILSHGGFFRFGEKQAAVPFSAFTYDREKKHLVLDTTREKLAAAPVYDKRMVSDHRWAEDVYRYFGQQPYWSEEGSGVVKPDYPENYFPY